MSDDDFLTDVWRVLARQVGTGSADCELLELRQRWGGARVYLKKAPALPTQIQVADHHAKGKPVREICADIGCSVAWGQRLLSRRLLR